MTILGIDPGYDRMGWAVLQNEKGTVRLLGCGAFLTQKQDKPHVRLLSLYQQLKSCTDTYHPQVLGMETLFFSKNQTTAIGVAESRGIVLLIAAQYEMRVEQFGPSQIKAAIAGSGRADKKAVEKMVRLQVQNIPEKVLDDTLDAIGIALVAASLPDKLS